MRIRQASVLLALTVSLIVLPLFGHAQAPRSYHYTSIADTIEINKDSTISVVENQTYQYVGAYHLGWRSIPLKDIDSITDISVSDGASGKRLEYSRNRLSKDDPASWGKYAYFQHDGEMDIEWYYSLADTTHTWVVSYKAHGAITFYKDHDELYWNLFTDYDVPVDSVEATIHLPGEITSPTSTFYTTAVHERQQVRPDPQTFYFKTSGISAREAVTFAVGWQKGLISKSAYWQDFFRTYLIGILSSLLMLASVLYGAFYIIHQYLQNKGRGTIIAQYEPPEHLTPAMADVVIHGYLSREAWAATVVDLAIRGFVSITEDEHKISNIRMGIRILLSIALLGAAVLLYVYEQGQSTIDSWVFGIPLLLAGGLLIPIYSYSSRKSQYIVSSLEKDKNTLLEYEKKFLNELFAFGGGTFSTRQISKSPSMARQLYEGLKEAEKLLDTDTQSATHAFTVRPGATTIRGAIASVFILLFFLMVSIGMHSQWLWLAISISVSLAIVFGVSHIPFLTKEGRILKEEWLGFKLYLETAEKYRMQNLTPDMFERYLPYAMIFGVEKQWAKNFDSMAMPPPSWYHGSGIVSGAGPSGSFSASTFSSGFSASFASAFASSGGGGASGGGGSAGGGGGGGGGGAA